MFVLWWFQSISNIVSQPLLFHQLLIRPVAVVVNSNLQERHLWATVIAPSRQRLPGAGRNRDGGRFFASSQQTPADHYPNQLTRRDHGGQGDHLLAFGHAGALSVLPALRIKQ